MLWIKKIPVSIMMLALLIAYYVGSGQLVVGF